MRRRRASATERPMRQAAPALPPGYGLLTFDEIDSTNAEAMRLARAGETGPLWIWARMQTLGRGRSGRTWASPRGNLYASLLIRLDCPPDVVHQLSLVAGVAAYEAIRSASLRTGGAVSASGSNGPTMFLSVTPSWPAFCPNAQACQVPSTPSSQRWALASTLQLIRKDWAARDESCRARVHRRACGHAGGLAEAMHEWLTQWDNGAGFARVRDAWLQRAGAPGERITINTGREVVEGSFLGIDPVGALVLRDPSGAQRRFTYGDVTLGAAAGANEQ